MDDRLRRVAEEEWGFMSGAVDAMVKTHHSIRHEWSEDVGEEHANWGEQSLALLAANERTHLWGRPGIKWVPDPAAPFDLEHVEIRDAAFVQNAIKDAIPNFNKGVTRWPLDSRFRMVNQDEMARIIGWSWVDQKQYVSEYFDCEDFAFCFKAEVSRVFTLNQVGVVIDSSGGHGYNLIVFPNGEVWFYEPINDCIVDIGAGIYKMEQAFILI